MPSVVVTRRGRSAITALLVALAVGACAEARRSLGEDCLKNEDCLSGVCSGLTCAAAPPLLDGSPGPVLEAGSDADGDASDASAPTDGASGG